MIVLKNLYSFISEARCGSTSRVTEVCLISVTHYFTILLFLWFYNISINELRVHITRDHLHKYYRSAEMYEILKLIMHLLGACI